MRGCLSARGSIFPIKDIPLETDNLADWLYQRFIEKEDLLSHFYETGTQSPIIHVPDVMIVSKMYFRGDNHFSILQIP